MSQEKQQEDRIEEESARFDTLLADTIEEIKAGDMQYIFSVADGYGSDISDTYQLYWDAPDKMERVDKEIESCIKAEAKLRVKHRLSGE